MLNILPLYTVFHIIKITSAIKLPHTTLAKLNISKLPDSQERKRDRCTGKCELNIGLMK